MMQLTMEKRGEVEHTESLDTRRVMLTAVIPLNEILVDFNDKIKSLRTATVRWTMNNSAIARRIW